MTGQIKTGSFGMINPLIRYEQKFNEKISASTTGEFMRADNLYPFTLVNGDYVSKEKRYNNNIQTYRGELNLYISPNNRSTLNGKIYYYDTNQQLPGAVILYNAKSREKLRERNFFSQVHYRTYWENNLSLLINGKFNWSQSHYHDEGGKYPGGELNDRYFQREYYTSGALLYTPTSHWSMVYAADYIYNNLNANTPNNTSPYRHSILQTATLRYQTDNITAVAILLGSIYLNGAKKETELRTGENYPLPSLFHGNLVQTDSYTFGLPIKTYSEWLLFLKTTLTGWVAVIFVPKRLNNII